MKESLVIQIQETGGDGCGVTIAYMHVFGIIHVYNRPFDASNTKNSEKRNETCAKFITRQRKERQAAWVR